MIEAGQVPKTYNGKNDVSNFYQPFLSGSLSYMYLQVSRAEPEIERR